MFAFEDNAPLEIRWRREIVFLVLCGLFLGSLTMLNILGITRIIDFSTESIPFKLTMGVLPYPVTFLCTDFISELYGRRRANIVVWVGLMLNLWVLLIIWLGGIMPPDLEQGLKNAEGNYNIDAHNEPTGDYLFYKIRTFTFSTTLASMIAYLTAQFCDVHIFHFLKKLTKGKHMWLRNNGSTMISQLVDSTAVIVISHFGANAFKNEIEDNGGDITYTLIVLILSGYVFKFCVALLDTIPFYFGTKALSRYLHIDPTAEYKEKHSS